MKQRALISVSDKTGVVKFAKELSALGYEIISTGGTEKALKEAGIATLNISEITGFPECLDGRVKTLHPFVHAGLLAMRSNAEHMKQLEKLGINTIDIVAVNLYPFKATISKNNVEFAEAVENIDIGGPTMLRSAAKNYQDVAVVTDSRDYQRVIDELKKGGVSLNTKKHLMYKVYAHTAAYDALISNYLAGQLGIKFPESLTLNFERIDTLRYGENSHQEAVYYKDAMPSRGALTNAVQLHGKELSFNNINDASAALELLKEFDRPAVVAVKHANPCGVGIASTVYDAYIKAYEADKISIFGGILAINGTVDKKTAEEINKIFIEIVVAADYTGDALDVLKAKQNIRLLKLNDIALKDSSGVSVKKVSGGLLLQTSDDEIYGEYTVVTKTNPTSKQLKDMKFAMSVVKHTRSNAIVLALDETTVGMGIGQTNRIWAAEQAIEHAGEKAVGAVMASDAFFPFSDCVEAAAKAGVKAIVQPGGSKKDDESIAACDKYGIAMIFTGIRHFKH
ncbi:MAG: bifunctional phosphoribosylaminoimidazolecarboxamide formyltransferase/IMP cyclohydrolase [Clostridiales bacterium]|jgi:phosphoribosylaminoimidazolecarboxamide formyltransferase/IMP cyclohydrolase|nr:bifunctional phosphoribosylaminoimidazolecarboxamide formyltransferase/IMP cyclohydrolase [Clostridiales bacterium]